MCDLVNYHHQRWWLDHAPLEGAEESFSILASPPKAAGSTVRDGGFYRVKISMARDRREFGNTPNNSILVYVVHISIAGE